MLRFTDKDRRGSFQGQDATHIRGGARQSTTAPAVVVRISREVVSRYHRAGRVYEGTGSGGLARRAIGGAVPTGGSLRTFAIMAE
jgi:hypothetical protein